MSEHNKRYKVTNWSRTGWFRYRRPKRRIFIDACVECKGNVRALMRRFDAPSTVIVYRWLKSFNMDINDYRTEICEES